MSLRVTSQLKMLGVVFGLLLLTSLPVWAAPSTMIFAPVGPQNENAITLAYPEKYRELGRVLNRKLYSHFVELGQIIGKPKNLILQIQLVEAERFYKETRVPSWTNAIYLKSQIIIPIKEDTFQKDEQLVRAIRHELVHAIVDHNSQGRCPGWIDEGLAQILEGKEHPALRRALTRWVSRSGPIQFDLLQGGFTKLSREMVPAAYAQSFYSVNLLKKERGTQSFESYFRGLGRGIEPNEMFQRAFGLPISDFERDMYSNLGRMANGHKHERPYTVKQVRSLEVVRASPKVSTTKSEN